MAIFVDTSALYAAADLDDTSHARAVAALSTGDTLVTSDHALVETWTLLRRRAGAEIARRFWAEIRAGAATVEPVLPADLEAAWQIGERFPNQDFSIVDRTSFALMERLGITTAASLDDDFAIYRYGPRLDRAFEIRR